MAQDHRSDSEEHELVGAFALDAMNELDRCRFELHLERCHACRTALVELQATAARLGDAESVAPPAAMRVRVLDAIGTIPQDAPDTPVEPPSPAEPVSPIPLRPRAARRPILAAAAAVLAFALVGLGGLYAQSASRVNQLQQQIAAGEPGEELLSVLSAADAQVAAVTVSNGGTAHLAWSGERDVGVFVGDGLAAAPDGRRYALWLIDAAGPRYAGSFDLENGGEAAAVIDGGFAGAQQLGVTAEPPGPIDGPTGDILMNATLSA